MKWFGVVALLGATAYAQGPNPVQTITCEGEAFVTAAPSFADFWFATRAVDSSNANAAAAALTFEDRVRAKLKELGLSPTSIEGAGVHVPDVDLKEARTSVRVRFSIVRFADENNLVTSFANICDDLATARDTLACDLTGPTLNVEKREETEQQAVARATENALYRADAAAALLQSQIVGVLKVEVLDTEWLLDPHEEIEHRPNLRQITCRGKVRVVYVIAPSQ